MLERFYRREAILARVRGSAFAGDLEALASYLGARPGTSARYQLALAYRRAGDAAKAREHQEIYNRLIQEQKAKSIGVRGSEPD